MSVEESSGFVLMLIGLQAFGIIECHRVEKGCGFVVETSEEFWTSDCDGLIAQGHEGKYQFNSTPSFKLIQPQSAPTTPTHACTQVIPR